MIYLRFGSSYGPELPSYSDLLVHWLKPMGILTPNVGKGLIFAGGPIFSPDFEIGWFKWLKEMLTGTHFFTIKQQGFPYIPP